MAIGVPFTAAWLHREEGPGSRLSCRFWRPSGYAVLAPQPAQAIPAFARKFGVKCYTCHTIPPALNKTGYMFKRLGYRMPPDEMDGTKPAPKITELDKDIKFNLTNSLAVITQGSFTVDKTTGDGTAPPPVPASTWMKPRCLSAGAVPETGFSYFTHFELYQGGSSHPGTGGHELHRRAAPTAAISSRPARCTCRKEKARGQPCSTTCSPIPRRC